MWAATELSNLHNYRNHMPGTLYIFPCCALWHNIAAGKGRYENQRTTSVTQSAICSFVLLLPKCLCVVYSSQARLTNASSTHVLQLDKRSEYLSFGLMRHSAERHFGIEGALWKLHYQGEIYLCLYSRSA